MGVDRGHRAGGGIEVYPATLAPLLQVLTAETDVLWLGYLLQVEPVVTTDRLAAAWSALPATYPRVEFLDAGAAIEADGRYQGAARDEDGRLQVLRQVDGRHLCPDGVVLMAEQVLAEPAGPLRHRAGGGLAAGRVADARVLPRRGPVLRAEDGTPRGIAS